MSDPGGASWLNAEPTGTAFETGKLSELRSSFQLKSFPALDAVLGVLPEGTFVGGGVFADMVLGRTPNDIDIFFSDLSVVPSVQDLLRRFEDYEAVAFSPTSSLLRSRSTKVTLNLLHSVVFADPSVLIDRFDLNVCQIATTPDGLVAYSSAGLEQALAHRMALHRAQPTLPIRLNKYRFKGFEISDELIEVALKFGASPYKYEQYRLRREHAKIYGLTESVVAPAEVAPAVEPPTPVVDPPVVPEPPPVETDEESIRRRFMEQLDPELLKLVLPRSEG